MAASLPKDPVRLILPGGETHAPAYDLRHLFGPMIEASIDRIRGKNPAADWPTFNAYVREKGISTADLEAAAAVWVRAVEHQRDLKQQASLADILHLYGFGNVPGPAMLAFTALAGTYVLSMSFSAAYSMSPAELALTTGQSTARVEREAIKTLGRVHRG